MPVTVNSTEISPGIWEMTVEPLNVQAGETITIGWETGSVITAEFTSTNTSEADVVNGLNAAIADAITAAGADGYWETVSVSLMLAPDVGLIIEFGDALGSVMYAQSDGGGAAVTTKIWTGNSVPRAQVTTLTPQNVLTGDSFSVKINGKPISVVATADSAANVATLLAAAIAASAVPEWREVIATAAGDVVTLTARTAGVPFTVTAGSSDAVGIEITTTTSGSSGTDAVQQFAVPKSSSGTFKITFGDQTTSDIAVGATASTVDTALEALSTIGSGNCAVTKTTSADGNDDLYQVQFTGTLAKTTVAQLIVDLTSTKPLIRTTRQGATTGNVANEIQTIDYGGAPNCTFTLTLDGQTTGPVSTAGTADDLRLTLQSLTNVESVTVLKSGSVFTVEFFDIDGSANQSALTASVYSSSLTGTHRLTITNTAGVTAINEVQKVAIQGTASGGTFTLTYSGQTTSSIAHNASTSSVASALEALSNIGVGDVAVTGAAGAWVVTFQGALAGTNVSQLTAISSLTGTAAANVTIATTTTSQGPNHWDTADNWLPTGVPATGDAVVIDLAAPHILYGLDQTGVTLASLRVSMSWLQGRIGLPRYTEAGYIEYRPRELTCGITSIVIGDGEGSGPTKIALNTGTVVTAITVLDCGGSSENGVPCVIWRGTHADNTVKVHGGDFGSAWWSDESAQISTIQQTDGTVFLKNTTIDDSIDCAGQDFRALRCTLGGKPVNV